MAVAMKSMEYEIFSESPNQRSIKLYYNKVTFDIQDVAYLESDVNYTIFHLADGKQHISAFTLKHHFEKLSHTNSFLRVNRSVCVNIDFIESRLDDVIILRNGKYFSVSRRRQKFLHERINSVLNN